MANGDGEERNDGLRMLADWITHHRMAVYRGAWRVLRSCRDLDNCLDDIADCVASATWLYVADNVNEFLNSSKPVSKKLSDKAENIARAWKSEKLRSDEGRPAVGYQIGLNGLEKITSDDEGDDQIEVDINDVIDGNANLNAIVILERPWTQADLEQELRRAGPFRVDFVYESDAQVIAVA